MNQEIFNDRAVLHFSSESAVVRNDRTHPGLVIGYAKDGKIVELILLNPKKRGNSDQVAVVDRYDPLADALDLDLDEEAWHETEESPLGFMIDYDSDRRIVALEFLGASRLFPEAALARRDHAA
jgi:uncharacterized protein YuzE